MSIYILKDNNEIGPLTIIEIQALLDANCINQQQIIRYSNGEQGTVQSIDGIRTPQISTIKTENNETQDAANAPMASFSRDIKNIRKNSSTVADELNQFLSEIRGKSPAEMLGAFAKSSLIQSTITATFILLFILIATTVVPLLLSKKTELKQNIQPEYSNTTPTNTTQAAVNTSNSNTTPTNIQTSEPLNDPKSVAETLGIGESKKGIPSEPNPFESTGDLLKELE